MKIPLEASKIMPNVSCGQKCLQLRITATVRVRGCVGSGWEWGRKNDGRERPMIWKGRILKGGMTKFTIFPRVRTT